MEGQTIGTAEATLSVPPKVLHEYFNQSLSYERILLGMY